jgi:hypothetical protein
MARTPTAALAAGSLIGGFGVAVASGSRPLGGLVLAAGGLSCAEIWRRRHGTRTAVELTAVGLAAFVLSHLLALAIGAWPAVFSVSAVTAAVVWVRSDAPSGVGAEAPVELS